MALVEVDLTWPSAAPGFPQSSLLTGRRCLVPGGLLQRELGCEGMDCAIDLVCDILDFLSSWCVPCGDFLTDCVMIAWLSTKETTSLKKTPSTTTSMQTQSISADVCHALHHLPSQNTPPRPNEIYSLHCFLISTEYPKTVCHSSTTARNAYERRHFTFIEPLTDTVGI